MTVSMRREGCPSRTWTEILESRPGLFGLKLTLIVRDRFFFSLRSPKRYVKRDHDVFVPDSHPRSGPERSPHKHNHSDLERRPVRRSRLRQRLRSSRYIQAGSPARSVQHPPWLSGFVRSRRGPGLSAVVRHPSSYWNAGAPKRLLRHETRAVLYRVGHRCGLVSDALRYKCGQISRTETALALRVGCHRAARFSNCPRALDLLPNWNCHQISDQRRQALEHYSSGHPRNKLSCNTLNAHPCFQESSSP